MSTVVANQPPETAPWSRSREPQVKIKPSKEVQWYQPELKRLPPSTIELFTEYAGLLDEEEARKHIYAVRDKAWEVLPYPCIGVFRFLDFSIQLSDIYPHVLSRIRKGATLLDLGCCVGQDLRKIAFDAGTSDNLIGADIEGQFIELGYELFRDFGRFQGQFTTGSVFDDDFLVDKRGKIDIIYLGSFLHLFNAAQQKQIVAKLAELLVPQAGSLVFGRNLGAENGGEFRMESIGWDLYRHSSETIRELFTGSGHTEWSVQSSLSRYESAAWSDNQRGWQGDKTKQMMFSAIRLKSGVKISDRYNEDVSSLSQSDPHIV